MSRFVPQRTSSSNRSTTCPSMQAWPQTLALVSSISSSESRSLCVPVNNVLAGKRQGHTVVGVTILALLLSFCYFWNIRIVARKGMKSAKIVIVTGGVFQRGTLCLQTQHVAFEITAVELYWKITSKIVKKHEKTTSFGKWSCQLGVFCLVLLNVTACVSVQTWFEPFSLKKWPKLWSRPF